MPDYKHRKIELIPRRQDDGTWRCPYHIIEFRPTCWGYHKGSPDGVFASREMATAAALEDAKRIVDTLKPPTHSSLGLRNARKSDEKRSPITLP